MLAIGRVLDEHLVVFESYVHGLRQLAELFHDERGDGKNVGPARRRETAIGGKKGVNFYPHSSGRRAAGKDPAGDAFGKRRHPARNGDRFCFHSGQS
jgi:hypothetical protein